MQRQLEHLKAQQADSTSPRSLLVQAEPVSFTPPRRRASISGVEQDTDGLQARLAALNSQALQLEQTLGDYKARQVPVGTPALARLQAFEDQGQQVAKDVTARESAEGKKSLGLISPYIMPSHSLDLPLVVQRAREGLRGRAAGATADEKDTKAMRTQLRELETRGRGLEAEMAEQAPVALARTVKPRLLL